MYILFNRLLWCVSDWTAQSRPLENQPRHKRHTLHSKTSERLWKVTLWRILILSDKAHRSAFSWSNTLYKENILKHNFQTPLILRANNSTYGFLTAGKFTSAISMSVKILIWASFMYALVFAGLGFWFAVTWHMGQISVKKHTGQKSLRYLATATEEGRNIPIIYFRTSVSSWWPSMLMAVYITIILNINITIDQPMPSERAMIQCN